MIQWFNDQCLNDSMINESMIQWSMQQPAAADSGKEQERIIDKLGCGQRAMGIGAQKLVPPLLSTSVRPRWSSKMGYVSAFRSKNAQITWDTNQSKETCRGGGKKSFPGAPALARILKKTGLDDFCTVSYNLRYLRKLVWMTSEQCHTILQS